MKTPTRFFLVCSGLAALAVAGDYLYLQYLESRLTTATAACEAESKRLVEASASKDKEKPKNADDYAEWIVKNEDKKGTEEFEFVARAYQEAKAEEERKAMPASDLTPEQLEAIENAKARRRLAELEDKAASVAPRKSQDKRYVIEDEISDNQVPSAGRGPWTYYSAKQGKNPFDQFDRYEFGGYVCEPLALATAGYDLESLPKVQQELVAAYWSAQSSDPIRFGLVWVSALLLLGILPHAWYFLLRRLREVAASIRGE